MKRTSKRDQSRRPVSRLQLGTETLRQLARDDLREVGGGYPTYTADNCVACSPSCGSKSV